MRNRRQPARAIDQAVETVAVEDDVSAAVGRRVNGRVDDFNSRKMRAAIVAQELVVVARNVGDAHTLLGGVEQLAEDLVVRGRPVPIRPQPPAVHDVADEVDRVGTVMAQELDEAVAPAGARAEMDIR